MVFAGGSIGTKVGAGVASALMNTLLSYAGYVTSTEGFALQPDSALGMIQGIYFWGPLIISLMVVVVLIPYKLDKKYDAMMVELEKREEKGEL